MDLLLVLCIAGVVLGLHAEDGHNVDTKHPTRISGHVSKDSGVHHMKKTVDDVDEARLAMKNVDGVHPVHHTDDIRTVNARLKVVSDKTASGKKMKKRLLKKRKLISRNKQRPKGRHGIIRIKKTHRKPSKNLIIVKRKNRKNKRKKTKALTKPNPQNKKRKMRKLQASEIKAIVDKITEEHKTGKGSKITTKYLKERVRALLSSPGFFKVANCKTRRRLKARKIKNRKKNLRQLKANRKNKKQLRNMRPRLTNKNKTVSRKVKKAMKNKKVSRKGKKEMKNKKSKRNKKGRRNKSSGGKSKKRVPKRKLKPKIDRENTVRNG